MRLRLAIVVVALAALVVPTQAGATGGSLVVSKRSPVVTWKGALGLAPLACAHPNAGCDQRDIVVDAPRGAWITVSISVESANLRVTSNGQYVGSGGQSFDPNPANTSTATTTFQQLRAGRVSYHVEVGSASAVPEFQTPFGGHDNAYTGQARLAGKAFDRAGDCGMTSGLEHVRDADPGDVLRLSVLLVAAPADVAEVRRDLVPGLIDTFDRIGVRLRVSVRSFPLRQTDGYPYEQVRQAYGGVRPPGVDVVDVLTDGFAGGIAACIGGIAYPEKAFASGSIHYAPAGSVAVPTVRGAMVAAHEIGHLLGAQHQQANCVEALPQLAQRPARDGSVGPCTVMSPAAAQISETFSTPERATIRHFVRTYARG